MGIKEVLQKGLHEEEVPQEEGEDGRRNTSDPAPSPLLYASRRSRPSLDHSVNLNSPQPHRCKEIAARPAVPIGIPDAKPGLRLGGLCTRAYVACQMAVLHCLRHDRAEA